MEMTLPNIRVTKKFHFEMAHALSGHDGPCKNIHGHSYLLSITVSGKPIDNNSNPKNGMVIDFSDLKKCINENIISIFDHALVLNESDKELIKISQSDLRVIYLPFPPTCEMLLAHFIHLLKNKIPNTVALITIRLDETASSYAEWHASDNN